VPLLGTLRRVLMAPSLHEVSFTGRGFTLVPTDRTRALEAVPQAVVTGFEWGIEDRDLATTERRLALVDPEHRGFAYEGATMACAIRDAIGPRRHRVSTLLRGGGKDHIFLNYIGIGFALAKLPRPLWRHLIPTLDTLDGPEFYPALRWLCVDGYGFDRAYFDTDTWVKGQRRDTPYTFDGHSAYWQRAVDQGTGRALWFIHGGHTDRVGAAVRAFASDRHADLWSGVGLAATFAGGASAAALATLRHTAGPHTAHLAQGAVFAAKARHHAGHLPGHTHTALHALTGLSADAAARLADDSAPTSGAHGGDLPSYEAWRQTLRARLSATDLFEHTGSRRPAGAPN
jgi:enediyne biosynthesis protein E2